MPNETNGLANMSTQKMALEKSQAIVDCNLAMPEGGIKQILGVNATCELKSYEVLDGEATYEGTITLEVLYQNNDDFVNSLLSTFPFSAKLIDDTIDINTSLSLAPRVLDTNIESVENDNLHIVCAVEVAPLAYISQPIKIATEVDGLHTKTASTQLLSLNSKNSATLKLDTSIATRESVQKILQTNSVVQIKNIIPQTGYVAVQGDAYVEILYITDGDEKVFKTQSQTLSFNEEIETSNINKESLIDFDYNIKKSEIQSVVSATGEKAVVDVSVPVALNIFALNREEVLTIVDAYSETNDVLVTTNSFQQAEILPPTFFEKKIDGVFELGDEELRIDKILAVSRAEVFETNLITTDNETIIEGVASLNLIYSQEDNLTISGKRVEIPFSISIDKVCQNADDTLVQMILTDVDVAVKKGREIYVDGKIRGLVSCVINIQCAVASEISLGEELPNKNFALEVYFAKRGQTLWDVAKDMHEDIEVLKTQNPDLLDELNGTEKIVCYRQSEINFA